MKAKTKTKLVLSAVLLGTVLTILILSVVLGGGRQATETSGSGFWSDWLYRHTKDVEVLNLRPQRICDIRPGEWVFYTHDQDDLRTSGRGVKADQSGFFVVSSLGRTVKKETTALRINGTKSGERVAIGQDGCATLSWNVTSHYRDAIVLGTPVWSEAHGRYIGRRTDEPAHGFRFSLTFEAP